ncbi:MAG: GNAT family N-acetyltransferase [Spirochaetes bacterium RIFOXYB1_FULL_32_8]|nr:MAG: GNAT family N-acetyltransferase [Spirochaetes bacterium RIFOXYB1_FULL_32_8]
MILDTPGATILVAVDNDKVIGMVSCQMTISTAEGGYSGLVEDMVIENGYRGKGIGTLLIQKIVEWCLSNGASRVQLLADKNNSDALSFYKKNKWTLTNMICLRAPRN